MPWSTPYRIVERVAHVFASRFAGGAVHAVVLSTPALKAWAKWFDFSNVSRVILVDGGNRMEHVCQVPAWPCTRLHTFGVH